MANPLPSARSWSDYSILGPYGIVITTLTTVSQQVLGVDNARNGVIFHNPGAQNKRVMPVGSALAGGSGGILIEPQTDYVLMKNQDSQFNINCAWIAVTDNNSDGSLTILNFTPNTPGAPMVQQSMRSLQDVPVASPVGFPTINLGLGSTLILAADPNRRGVQFHNPSGVVEAVCPSNLAASIGAGSIIVLPGDTKTIIGNDRVKVNCGFNGVSASAGPNAITVLGLYG